MWSEISVMQMTSYITLVDLYFPANFLNFMGYIESAHDFNRWAPNPFALIFPRTKLNMSVYNEHFYDRGFTNRQILYLCGSDLLVLGAVGIVILLLIPLAKYHAVFRKLLKGFRFSSISRSFIQAYLKICLAGFINVGMVSFIFLFFQNFIDNNIELICNHSTISVTFIQERRI